MRRDHDRCECGHSPWMHVHRDGSCASCYCPRYRWWLEAAEDKTA